MMDTGFSIEDVIIDALERIGGEASEASEVLSARRSIRLLLEEWAAMGLNTWRLEHIDIALPSTSEGHVLQPNIDDVLDVTIRTATGTQRDETVIERAGRSEYVSFPDKSQTGRPGSWYLRRTEPPQLFLWPVGTEEYLARVYFMARPTGPDAYGWEVDAPTRWLPALVHGVAYDLGQKRPGLPEPTIARLRTNYGERLQLCKRNDRDRVSFYAGIGGPW
jgi:hypothetical protein